jgi:hypothetical protein
MPNEQKQEDGAEMVPEDLPLNTLSRPEEEGPPKTYRPELKFEPFLRDMVAHDMPVTGALIQVLNTAMAARLWFNDNLVPCTAGDIIALTGLVFQQDAALRARSGKDGE